MSSLQELKVGVQAGQQNARKGQNRLHFLFKRDMKSRMEQVGKEEGSHRTKDTAPLAQLLWDGQVDTRATQSNRNRENAILQAKSHRKQLTRGTHSHQQMHKVALPSSSIYDTPQLYTLRMTVLYWLIQAEFFSYSFFHIIVL